MAMLHYQNLGLKRPDITFNNTWYGLKSFSEFLRRTKEYMQSDASTKRLAWKTCNPPEEVEDYKADYVWVQLEEPKDRPNEPDSTFRAFMDENVKDVYELQSEEIEEHEKNHIRKKISYDLNQKIKIIDRDPENYLLLLERKPNGSSLLLRPNTYTIHCQLKAIENLQSSPSLAHLPLIRLMESLEHARWPIFRAREIEDWMVLTDESRSGAIEQRLFVSKAVSTPDFVFLEGPPGSGKTTAICELILQMAKEGKRVLLCASTHVAVDNVLERLMDARNAHRDLVIPIRIGEKHSVSEKARPWQLEEFIKTERKRLLDELSRLPALSKSQQLLRDDLTHHSSSIERMVLDASNLVCGTTIGILQHPDIKKNKENKSPIYDLMIIDEASKTTFQEFLVPAMLAKRWIIVGDPKQLSPYVDDVSMAVNIESCLPNRIIQNACVDVFMADMHQSGMRRVAAIATNSPEETSLYLAQAGARNVDIGDASFANDLWKFPLIVGSLSDLEDKIDELPLDIVTLRAPDNSLHSLRRKVLAWCKLQHRVNEEQSEWSSEIAWRLCTQYELRFSLNPNQESVQADSPIKRLDEAIKKLLPERMNGVDPDKVKENIDIVRRVALPSILESLRYGFERHRNSRSGTALTDGFPENVLKDRHILLSAQHRMHPEIASFCHENIYDRKALHTSENMIGEREWSYSRHAHRTVWMDVKGGFKRRFNANDKEAKLVLQELKHFDQWAKQNPRPDGHPWEAAVLTFYRGQEREVRKALQHWTSQRDAIRHFKQGSKHRPYLSIELCTVDRFQGHEADIVILTFASDRPTNFLISPNRMNVALTRAKYQRIIIGNRKAMQKSKQSLLGKLAETENWDTDSLGGNLK